MPYRYISKIAISMFFFQKVEQYTVLDRYIHTRDVTGHDYAYYGMTFNDSPLLPRWLVNILTVNPFVRKIPEDYGKRQSPSVYSDIFDDINELAYACVRSRYRR